MKYIFLFLTMSSLFSLCTYLIYQTRIRITIDKGKKKIKIKNYLYNVVIVANCKQIFID